MLAVACPGCGAPCRVSLERPDFVSCASCGKVGPPPEIARAHLAAAQRVLSQTDERTRQLRGLSRILAGGAAAAVPMYLLVAALLALWSGAFVHGCQGDELPKYGVAVEWILPAAGAALSLLVALPAFVSITRSARKLHDLASATPPLRAGEPAACRVCGAPVGGVHGVVRCRHCRADNIVDAQVMARAGRRHELEVRDLEAEVRSLTSEIGETRFVGLTFSVALSAFAVPMVAIILGDNALEHANVSLDSDARYVVAEDPAEGDGLRTCLHARGGPTHPTYFGQHHPSWIVGSNLVRTDWRGQALQVTGVARNLAFGDVAVIRDAAGARSLVLLDGLCVIGAPPGVAPPAPPPTATFKLPPAPSSPPSE